MLTYGFLKKVLNGFIQIILPYKLIGREKVQSGACILVGNHYRIWDIVHMACVTEEKVHFITKRELYNSKFLAHLCDIVEAIPVSRDGQDAKAVMTALRYLKKGEKISIFPEGTRNRTDAELLPLKGGAALFAIKAKVPLYPVMCLHKTRPFKRTKHMTSEDYAEAEEIIRDRMIATKQDYIRAEKERKLAKKKSRRKEAK